MSADVVNSHVKDASDAVGEFISVHEFHPGFHRMGNHTGGRREPGKPSASGVYVTSRELVVAPPTVNTRVYYNIGEYGLGKNGVKPAVSARFAFGKRGGFAVSAFYNSPNQLVRLPGGVEEKSTQRVEIVVGNYVGPIRSAKLAGFALERVILPVVSFLANRVAAKKAKMAKKALQ